MTPRVSWAFEVLLPSQAQQHCDHDAKRKSSQYKPSSPNVEPDSTHHQECNRHQKSGKFRVHPHHAPRTGVAFWIA